MLQVRDLGDHLFLLRLEFSSCFFGEIMSIPQTLSAKLEAMAHDSLLVETILKAVGQVTLLPKEGQQLLDLFLGHGRSRRLG